MATKQLISIVTPVYNEKENIPIFYRELLKATRKLAYTFELIFVDDGSIDESVDAIEQLKSNGITIRLVELSRNFGKEIATTAGLHAAKGNAVIIMDSDLQHPLHKIKDFVSKWSDGHDIVIGVRTVHKHETAIKKYGSKFFYQIMNRISEIDIIPHSTDYRLLDRRVVNAFNRFTERQRITRGLIDWLGFKKATVEFEALERQHGEASYTTAKLVRLARDSFTSHSLLPLKIAGYLGSIITPLAGIVGVLIIIENYVMHDPMGWAISGTAMLAVMLTFLVGIILICLGLVAMYITNIHGEVINRPLYVIRQDKEVI